MFYNVFTEFGAAVVDVFLIAGMTRFGNADTRFEYLFLSITIRNVFELFTPENTKRWHVGIDDNFILIVAENNRHIRRHLFVALRHILDFFHAGCILLPPDIDRETFREIFAFSLFQQFIERVDAIPEGMSGILLVSFSPLPPFFRRRR